MLSKTLEVAAACAIATTGIDEVALVWCCAHAATIAAEG